MAEETTPIDPQNLSSATPEDIAEAVAGQPSVVQEGNDETPDTSNDVLEVSNASLRNMMYRDGDGHVNLYNANDGRMDQDFDQFSDRSLFGLRTTKKLNQGSTFTGFEDTYNRSQEAQGVAGKLSNTMLGFVSDTAINVAQGTAGMLYGAGSAIVNGDLTKIYDNTLSNALDRAQEGFNEQFEVTRGGNQGLAKKGVNLVDDLAGALSFVAGAVLTEVGLSAATVATMGGAAPVQAAATAGIVARGSRMLKQMASGGRRFIGKSAVDDALKGAAKLGDDATRATAAGALGQAGAAIDKASKISSLARVSRQLLTGAGMEAGMEARHMLNEATEERAREYENEYGVPMAQEMKDAFREKNSKYGDAVFAANLALVGVGNMLMFPKLFGLGMRRGMNVERFIKKSGITNPRQQQRIAKAYGKKWDELPDILDVQRARRVAYSGDVLNPLGGRMGRATARSRSALYEGFVEEGGQGTISRSTKDYIAQKYDPDNRDKVVSYTDSFIEGLKGAYGTAEGLKEVALGITIGYMGLPNVLIGNVYSEGVDAEGKKIKPRFIGGASEVRRQQLERDKQVDRILQLHKENGEVGAVMRAELDHAVRMQGLEKQHKEASENGDLKVLKDVEGDTIFSFASSKIVTGRFDDAIAEYKGIMEEQTPEEFREMLAESDGVHVSNMSEEEILDAKTRATQRYVERMTMVKQAYEASESIYQGEDPEIHTALAHMLYNINDKDARERAMAEQLSKELRQLTGAEVLDAVKVMTAFNVDEKTLDKAIKSQRRLKAIDKQLETKRAAGQISNVDEGKVKARQEEVQKLEEERERIMQERQELEDALSGEYGFDLDKAQQRVDALFRLNEALIESGEEIGSFAQNGLDKDTVLNDLLRVSLDRQAMIRGYNMLLEPGGYDRFVASLSGGIQAQLKEDPVKVAEENEAKRTHEEADETESRDENNEEEDVTRAQAAERTRTDQEGEEKEEDNTNVAERVEYEDDDTFIPADPNEDDDDAVEVGVGEDEDVTRAQAKEAAKEAKKKKAKPTTDGRIELVVEGMKLDASETSDNGKPNPKREGAAQAIRDNVKAGDTITIRMSGGFVYYMYKGQDIHSVNADNVPAELRVALEGGVELEAKIKQATQFAGTRTRDKDGNQIAVSVAQGFTGENGEAQLGSIEDIVLEFDQAQNGLGPGRRNSILTGESVNATRKNARGTAGSKTRHYIVTKDANGNRIAFDIAGKEVGAKVAQSMVRMYELALVADSFATAADIGMTEAQYDAAWAKLSKDFNFNENEKAKYQVDAVFNSIVAPVRKDDVINRPRIKYLPASEGKPPALFIENVDDKGKKRKPLKYTPKNAKAFLAQLSRVQYAVQLPQMDFEQLPVSMDVNQDGSIDVDFVGKKEWYGQNMMLAGHRPIMIDNKPYVELLHEMVLETKAQIVPAQPEQNVEETIDGKKQTDNSDDVSDDDFSESEDDFSIVLDEDEEDLLKRAADLYSIEGFTVRRVQDTVNVLAGKISQQILAQSRSKGRSSQRSAASIKGELKKNLKAYQAKLEAKVANESISKSKRKISQARLDHVTKMLEPKTFDQFVELAFHEVLRQADGVVKVNSKSLVSSIDQIEANQELARNAAEKMAGEEGGATINTEDEEAAVENEPSALAAFDDNFAFGTDPGKTMRFELRLAMMGLRYRENTPATTGVLGKKFIDFKTLQSTLQPMFVGVEPSWDAVQKVLQDRADQMPVIQDILDMLDTEGKTGKDLDYRKMMRQQFVVWAHKEDGSHVTIKLTPYKKAPADSVEADTPGIIYQFDSNEVNMDKFVVRVALQNMLNRNFFKLKEGETVLNRDIVDEVLGEMDRIAEKSENKALDTAKLMYKYFGLQVPVEALNDANEDFSGIEADMSNKDFVNTSYGKFRRQLRAFSETTGDVEATSWYGTKANQQSIEGFFGAAAKHQQNLIQMVSRDADGKLRYHYHAPKLLTVQLHNLRRDELSAFDEGNPLVAGVRDKRNQTAEHKVRIDYVNGIKNSQQVGESRKFHAMEEPDQIIARMSFMGNDNALDARKRPLSRHMLPTLADKSTMPLIRVPSMSTALMKKGDVKGIPLSELHIRDLVDVKGYYDQQLRYAVEKELDMIQSQRVNGVDAKFVLFPELNSLLPEGMITANKRAAVHAKAATKIEGELQTDFAYVMQQLETEAYDLKKDGAIGKVKFFNKGNTAFVKTHIGEQNADVSPQGGLALFAAKYVAESRAVNAQSMLAFAGSTEAFLKMDKNGALDTGKTIDNIGKRLAGLIAPGNAIPLMTLPNGQSNESINILVLQDKKHDAEHIKYLRKIGVPESEIKDKYMGIDAADAAEYVTAEEHLGILLAQGKMSEEEYNGILPKVKSGTKLDVDELSWFQPMKPVNVERGANGVMNYIKSAQFPLLPEFTKGTELDKLRKVMEEKGIDRAIHKTAYKVGSHNMPGINIYAEGGKIEIPEDIKEGRAVLSRRGMRIQQEVPVSRSKEKIHGSQVAKLVLSNIARKEIDGFSVNGVEMNGKQAHEHYLAARKEERMVRRQIFAEKYGFDFVESGGNVSIRYNENVKPKLAERIIEEAQSRGYDVAEISHLRLDLKKNRFRTPLWASISEERVNNLLQAIYRKEVIESKIAGFAGPIAPAMGISYADMSDMEKSGIVWVGNKFDGKKLRVGIEGKPDQILMPWKFKGQLQKFIDPKTKRLDMAKVPEELLQVFAYRIPNQKKASSGSFEIVGFLPDAMGDTLIVPDELVGRIGQDFDIDKMFGMMYTHRLDKKTGNLAIVREGEKPQDRLAAARNRQIDVYHASMRNPNEEVQKEIHTPVSNGYSETLVFHLKGTNERMSPLSIRHNVRAAIGASSAKSAIGVMANANVVHTQMEMVNANVHYMKTIKEKGKNGKIKTVAQIVRIADDVDVEGPEVTLLAKLGKRDILDKNFLLEYPGGVEAGTVQDQFSRLLNHAVDNANDQLLEKLGIDKYTYPFWVHMTNMGYNMETISMMVRQPEVREAIAVQRRFSAVSNNEYFDLMEHLEGKIEVAREEYKNTYGPKATVKGTMAKTVLAARAGLRGMEVDAETEAQHKIKVLEAFKTLSEVEGSYHTLLPALKMDTQSPKNRGEFFYKMERARVYRKYHEGRNDENYRGPRYSITFDAFGSNTGTAMFLDSFMSSSVSGLAFQDAEKTNKQVLQLPGEHLEGTPFGFSLIEAEGKLSREFQTEYFKGLRSYLAAEWVEQRTGKSARTLRRELAVNQETSMARKYSTIMQNHPELRNNLFLKHLQAFDVTPNKEGLHTLEFQGDRTINVSPEQLHSAFLALARHDNAEVKQFATDLVHYDLVMRGTLGSKSFGKYIPGEMLQMMGIQDQYDPNQARFQRGMMEGKNEAMHRQIIQHNPKITPVVDVVKPVGYRHMEDTVQFETNYKNTSVGYVRDARGDLYKITGVDDKGIATAKGVAKAQSTYLYNLYSSQEELTNSHEFSEHYKENKLPPPPVEEEVPAGEAEVVSEEPAPVVTETEATVQSEEVAEEKPEGTMSFDEAVAALKGENNVLLQRLLMMNEKLSAQHKVQVSFREGGNHKYNAGVITMNSNAATADRLAHEMIHHMSRIGVNMPQNKENRTRLSKVFGQVTKEPALASRFGLNTADIARLQRGYKALQDAKGNLNTLEENDTAMMDYTFMVQKVRSNPEVRGLLNLEEFIAESMTNPDFAAVLNEIKVSPNKTLLERVYEIIADIINTLNTEVLGDPIQLSKDSALAEVSAAAYAMMETTAEGLSNIKENGAGSQMELFSVVIPEGVEDEVLKATDAEVLKQYKKRRIAEFEELRARFGESPKVVADINKRILQERMELMKLEDKDDDSVSAMVLVDMAQRELEDVDEVVRNVGKATTRDSRHAYAHARLQNAQAVLDFYSKGRKLLGTKGLTRTEIGRLQGVASQLQDDWMGVSAEILQNYARTRYKGTELEKLVDKDTFRTMKNIGALNSMFLDASRVGRVELSYLDGVVRDAAQAQRAEWVARNEVFQEKSTAFKETAFFKKYGWSGMVKGTEENQTNELIGPISREWDIEMKQRRDEAFKTKKHGPFKAWMKKNTVTVNMRLYDLDGDTAVRRKDPKIELELDKKLGKAAARELMGQQDRLAQLYLDNRRAAFDMIEVNEPAVKHAKLKAQWVKKNGFANEYSEYTYRMPSRFIDGKETKWHDSRFIEMQKEPSAMEFYEMYREQMRELTATLPRHEMTSKQISLMEQGLFIPAVKQKLTAQWWKSDNKRQELTEAMYASLTTKIEDSLAKSIDPVTGEVRRNLPTYFVQEIKNKAQMEYDLDKNFAAFSMMATTYKHKNNVEDEVRMIEAVLNDVGITHQNGMGQKILNKAGAVMSSNTQSARGNVGRSVRSVMDGFYGRRSNLEGKVLFGTKKARTEAEKNREASIKRGLEQLEEDRRTGAIPKRLYEEQKAQLEEDLSNVGSKYDAAKVIRTFVQYMQMKGMAWNIPAAQVNAVFGTMQVMKHAAGRRDFDESDARKAFGIMMHSTMNMVTLNTGATKTATAGKLQGLMTNLNLLKDFTEIEFDTSKADVLGNKRKGISKLYMYEIQRSSEYFTYGHTMVSHLLKVKVDGVSLFEATDENGIIQLEGYRPGEAKFIELANRLDQINKRIHGNYDPNSVMPIKQTLLGPMLMQFRSWLPEGFATRYENERFDPLLNRQVKGSIRTVLLEGSVGERLRKLTDVALVSVPLIGARKDLQGYTEVDEENVRKFAASVRQMMWVYLLVLALRAMKDDEDDEEVRYLFNYGLNLSSRIDNDLKFFGQVGAQRRIMQDVLPILKIAEDIEQFGGSVVDTVMGEGTIPTGVYAGESKLWLRGSKLVPHTEAYQRIVRNLSQEMK